MIYLKKPKKKQTERKTVSKRLDVLTSLIVRHRDLNLGCICCGKKFDKPIGYIDWQCGHWFNRGVAVLRYDLRNCNGQCSSCNRKMKYGDTATFEKYRAGLIDKIGIDEFNNLSELAKNNKFKKFTINELRELRKDYELILKRKNGTL